MCVCYGGGSEISSLVCVEYDDNDVGIVCTGESKCVDASVMI